VKFDSVEAFHANTEESAGRNWSVLDQEARSLIKAELGHGADRDDVVSVYLGSA
jgi:hypothetical protein